MPKIAEIANMMRSPLRLWLLTELFGEGEIVLTVDDAAVQSGRHPQDVEACMTPMIRWGLIERFGAGYRRCRSIPEALAAEVEFALQEGAPRVERERHVRRMVLGGMIGLDPKMQLVFEMIHQVARVDVPVLVTGETGAGKEMVARAIHEFSRRREAEFGAVNCATLTEDLFGSTMFGHVRGAFTGAVRNHIGLFERCDAGTVFLDEVGDLSLTNQVRLLRVLQEGTFLRVGDDRVRSSDFRLVCATNRDLPVMVAEGTFREDLYYRLNVFPMRVPSLRERRGDIPYLVREIISERLKSLHADGSPPSVSAAAMERLCAYDWPGNVRQLENVLMRSVVLTGGGPLEVRHLAGMHEPAPLVTEPPARAGRQASAFTPRPLKEVEREHIERVLAHSGHNVSAAAKILEISRTTLYKKMQDYGLKS